MKNILGLTVALILVGIVGCKDDTVVVEPTDTTPKTNFEMVTEGSWRIESGTIVPSIDIDIQGTVITVNEYWDLLAYQGGGQVMDCDKDNLMFLNADSTVLFDEGPTKCDAGDPQTEDGGKWFFLDNETKLNFSKSPFDPSGAPQTFDIELLTASKLNLKLNYEFKNPIDGKTTDHVINLNYINTK